MVILGSPGGLELPTQLGPDSHSMKSIGDTFSAFTGGSSMRWPSGYVV